MGAGAAVDDIVVECRDPGVEDYGFKQGTSMATPHVAGVAALLLTDDGGLAPGQLKNTLLASADPIPSRRCRTYTGGRLNAAAALAASPVTTPPPTSCPPVTTTTLTPVTLDPPAQPPAKKKKRKK
ncbi:hypothetical protein BH20ACT15_BH20ACT15_14650 [soil metagenome]